MYEYLEDIPGFSPSCSDPERDYIDNSVLFKVSENISAASKSWTSGKGTDSKYVWMVMSVRKMKKKGEMSAWGRTWVSRWVMVSLSDTRMIAGGVSCFGETGRQ